MADDWLRVVSLLIQCSRGNQASSRALDQILPQGSPLRGWIPSHHERLRLQRLQGTVDRLRAKDSSHAVAELDTAFVRERSSRWLELKRLAAAFLAARAELQPMQLGKSNIQSRRSQARSPRTRHRTKVAQNLPRRLYAAVRCAMEELGRTKPVVRSSVDLEGVDQGVTICIDEQLQRGVIAGLVWTGKHPDPTVLRLIPDHSIQALRKTGIDAVSALLSQRRALPFIFQFTPRGVEARSSDYDELFATTVQLLLGWVLPRRDRPVRVQVLADRFADNQHGCDRTEFFRGLLAGHSRYSGWDIRAVKWLDTDRTPTYIPYADCLAYLVLEGTEDQRHLARMSGYRDWPGYIPLTPNLVRDLERVEALQETGAVGPLLDLGWQLHGTKLLASIKSSLKEAVGANRNLHLAALSELDRRYRAKERDLRGLAAQVEFLGELFGDVPETGAVRHQLLWSAAKLQQANHEGDPVKAHRAADAYSAVRAGAIANGLFAEVVHADLHSLVAMADRFAPAEALSRLEATAAVPMGETQRGKLASLRGQLLAMLGRHEEAEHCFVAAIQSFAEAEMASEERTEEADQTAVYRAINAMDGKLESAKQLLEAVIADPVAAASQLAATVTRPFHHHLLLRAIWFLPGMRRVRDAYLAASDHWGIVQQHPWELIEMYRGLLLATRKAVPPAAAQHFEAGVQVAATGGLTLKLVGAMVAAVGACCGSLSEQTIERARVWLNEAMVQLPDAAHPVEELRAVLASPGPAGVRRALAALRFNYR